jgi:hypothetical protein
MKSVHSATPREKELAAELRELCVAEIAASDHSDVCEKLGYAPTGLDRFLARPTWDLQLAFRAADALGLRVVDKMIRSAQANASIA